MTETPSETDNNLLLLDEVEDFRKHSLKLIENSRRSIVILSTELDNAVYDRDAFFHQLLMFIQSDPNSHIKVLVKNIRPLVERGHAVLRLARRLPSKVEIRKLLIEPENNTVAYLIGDAKRLLYKHDDLVYQGFVNYQAAPECVTLVEEFTYLWEQHSIQDPSLRRLLL